ncbi:hypothetical protein SK128_014177, partial [Halocaridina rubra]
EPLEIKEESVEARETVIERTPQENEGGTINCFEAGNPRMPDEEPQQTSSPSKRMRILPPAPRTVDSLRPKWRPTSAHLLPSFSISNSFTLSVMVNIFLCRLGSLPEALEDDGRLGGIAKVEYVNKINHNHKVLISTTRMAHI